MNLLSMTKVNGDTDAATNPQAKGVRAGAGRSAHALALMLIVGALLVGPGGSVPVRASTELEQVAALAPEDQERFRTLTREIRCLVCQNQSIADSHAELAQDLRREVLERIDNGQSDAEILDFLVTRYGDFVLYKPPLKENTVLLWAGPGVLVLLGAVVFFRVVRARAAMPVDLAAGGLEDEGLDGDGFEVGQRTDQREDQRDGQRGGAGHRNRNAGGEGQAHDHSGGSSDADRPNRSGPDA